MGKIEIQKSQGDVFIVKIHDSIQTEHKVTLSQAYFQQLTGGDASPEELVKRSFEFLLNREPNTSILRTFELPVIGRYFPEYEQKMRALFNA